MSNFLDTAKWTNYVCQLLIHCSSLFNLIRGLNRNNLRTSTLLAPVVNRRIFTFLVDRPHTFLMYSSSSWQLLKAITHGDSIAHGDSITHGDSIAHGDSVAHGGS